MNCSTTVGQLLCSASLAALIAGCSSPHKHVARKMDDLRGEWMTNLATQAQLPERPLDWTTAVTYLKANNLKLRQARTDVTNSQESVRQVFRDLAPPLNLHAGLSKRLVDFPSITAKDVNFSVDSFFHLPGLVNFGARLYMMRLAQMRAEAACALAEREQIIELYRLFWMAQDVQEQSRHILIQKETARAYGQVDPFSEQMLLTESELGELARQQEMQTLQQRASELLGSQAYRWVFTTNGLPDLRYDIEPLPLDDTNRVAQLQLRLAAIELEGARAELHGIKLRYWPELNIFITGPPLYQHAGGQEHFWDAHDLQLTADVFWTIDTRGYISRQLRQSKRQQALQQERLRQQAVALSERLLTTQDLIKGTHEKVRDLEQQIQVLEAVPPAQNLASLQKFAVDYQATLDQLRRARRDLAELNALFWFVDEKAWAEMSPLQPLVAARQ